MAKQLFRVTYRLETYIEAENFNEARNKFHNAELKDLNENAEFVELERVEDEQNRMEHEVQ